MASANLSSRSDCPFSGKQSFQSNPETGLATTVGVLGAFLLTVVSPEALLLWLVLRRVSDRDSGTSLNG